MKKKPWRYYYLIKCDHGFRDVLVSARRLNPEEYPNELITALPDANGRMHRVRSVHLIGYRDFRDLQRRIVNA